MTNILALVSHKGGTGKTTTTVNLASYFNQLGKRVLVIDLDQQAHASLSLGISRPQLRPSLADAIAGNASFLEAARELDNGLHVLVSDIQLASADLMLAGRYGQENWLRNELDVIKDLYDWILIDCPPSFSLLVVNALLAADCFLVPVQSNYLPLEGLASLLEIMDELQRNHEVCANLLGILVTFTDKSKLSKLCEAQLRSAFTDKVFQTVVPRNIDLAAAPGHGISIFEYAPRSRGAVAYRELAKELLERGDW